MNVELLIFIAGAVAWVGVGIGFSVWSSIQEECMNEEMNSEKTMVSTIKDIFRERWM